MEADLARQAVLLKSGSETPEIGWTGEIPKSIQRLFDEQRSSGETASTGVQQLAAVGKESLDTDMPRLIEQMNAAKRRHSG